MILIGAILSTSVIGVVITNYENMIKFLMRSSQQEVSIEGLPSFITSEMILASLQVQETYGYPASVCIAQVKADRGYPAWHITIKICLESKEEAALQGACNYQLQNRLLLEEATQRKHGFELIIHIQNVFKTGQKYYRMYILI